MHDLRYPLGPFEFVESLDPAARSALLAQMAGAPKHLRAAVAGLSGPQLDTPYRPGGWTLRQLVHHLADGLSMYVGSSSSNRSGRRTGPGPSAIPSAGT